MYDHCNVDENRHYQLANKHEYGDREYNYHHNGIDLYGKRYGDHYCHADRHTDITTSTATTTSATTSTVAAPNGFIPIQTSLPGSSYSGSGGGDQIVKRDIDSRGTSRPYLGGPVHPIGVTCHKWIEDGCIHHVTTIKTTMTISPSTTVTSTSTTTPTTFPSATTMTTATSTSTTTATASTTSTATTATTGISTTSIYAACATNNLADTYQSSVIGNVLRPSDEGQGASGSTSAETAEDCCVATLFISNVENFIFLSNVGSGNVNCYYAVASTCPSQTSHQFAAVKGDQGLGQITTGNQPCGVVSQAQ